MMGSRQERDEKLFYVGLSLDQRMPADHPLRRIDAVLDLSFVRPRVAHLYGRNGHVSLDPALVLRLILLTYLEGVRSERDLMRQLPMRLDWLWFCKLDLDSKIPDHSVLSKARRRWGSELFEELFSQVLEQCVRAGLADGKTVHADSTLLRANADRDRRVSRKLWDQLEGGLGQDPKADADDPPDGPTMPPPVETRKRPRRAIRNSLQVSPTDPDATIHTRQGVGTILGYRDHRLVDDACGIILTTHVTPADRDDGVQLPTLLDQMYRRLDSLPQELTGDSHYGTLHNYELCERLGILPYLKKRRGKTSARVWWAKLLPSSCNRERARQLSGRRRHVVEGSFAEAHTRMDHRRCRWRRLDRVQIQAYLVATSQNLKKLASRKVHRPATATAIGLAAGLERSLGQLGMTALKRLQRSGHPTAALAGPSLW